MDTKDNDYRLADELGIAGVESLHEELRARLDAGQPTRFLADGIGRIDAAAMQVLAAYVRESRAKGHAIEWVAPSPALQRAAHLLGLDQLLGMPARSV